MVNRKQNLLTIAVASVISVGVLSSVQSLLLPMSHQAFAQVKPSSSMEMMNGSSNASSSKNMSSMMSNMQKMFGMSTGSMKTNMTMDQLMDMMDMMHNVMMNMMRMMVHNGTMKGGNMTGDGNMNTMGKMQ